MSETAMWIIIALTAVVLIGLMAWSIRSGKRRRIAKASQPTGGEGSSAVATEVVEPDEVDTRH